MVILEPVIRVCRNENDMSKYARGVSAGYEVSEDKATITIYRCDGKIKFTDKIRPAAVIEFYGELYVGSLSGNKNTVTYVKLLKK